MEENGGKDSDEHKTKTKQDEMTSLNASGRHLFKGS